MKSRIIRLFRRLSLGLSFVFLIAAFLLVILWNVMVHTIPVGHAGVLWHRIFWMGGAVSKGPLAEGLHIILPWDKIYIYDLRLQVREQKYQVLSKDGLAFDVELSFRWRVAGDHLVALNQNFGPDYVDNLMAQEIGSVTREIMALYTAEALFTGARTEVQQAIYDRVTEASLENGIGQVTVLDHDDRDVVLLSDILIKHVELPERIVQAIESKLEQAQVVEEYRFRVQREALESERKSVEADGIRRFQEIVTPAITESYLRWRGIEATLQLAQSPNSKVVVIGNSATGLPLILDTATGATSEVDASGTPVANEPNLSLDDSRQMDQGSLDDIQSRAGSIPDMRRALP
jgi:regulator of protease activity HflC (stomatin/prohibitin superfamily)